MKLAIVGSRTFDDYGKLVKIVGTYFPFNSYYMLHTSEFGEYEIVSGGAKGADSLAKQYAQNCDIKYTEFPALWEIHGKAAGFIRNGQIINYCDMVLAFWDGKSRGTEHCINLAKQAKKPTLIVYI